MRKHVIPFLLACMLSLSMVPGAALAAETVNAYDTLTQDGVTYLPLRSVAEELGFTVCWDQNTTTATLTKNNSVIRIQPFTKKTTVNFVAEDVDVPMTVKSGHIYVDQTLITKYADGDVTLADGKVSATVDSMASVRNKYRASNVLAKERYDVIHKSLKLEGETGYYLVTEVFLPDGEGPWPTVMSRTPYPTMAASNNVLGEEYAKRGIAYVYQFCRGKGGSDGNYEPNTYEKADGTALMNWICSQDWCESLGIQGMSYMAYCAWCLADDLNPKVKALYVEEYGVDRFISLYRDGLFRQDIMSGWAIDNASEITSKPTKDLESPYYDIYKYMPQVNVDVDVLGAKLSWYRDWITNTNYNDEYWNQGVWAQLKNVPAQVNIPVTVVAGLYDHHMEGTLLGYERLNDNTKAKSRLILGPWNHGYGITPSHVKTDHAGDIIIAADTFNWFYSILEKGVVPEANVQAYMIEEDKWITTDSWPISSDGSETYYFTTRADADNSKAYVLSTENQSNSDTIKYVYDPENPVISNGGETLFTSTSKRGSKLQEKVGYRDDVISFVSEPLGEDLAITGKITAKLNVSTNVDDTCFTYKVCEVLPNGDTYNIRSGITTLAYRNNSLGDRQTYTPNDIVEINIETLPITWNVKAGNSIRIDITSSNFPEYAIHSNYAGVWAEQTQTRIANQVIYIGGDYASSVTFPIMNISLK